MTSYYVYYKVTAANQAALKQRIDALFAAVEQQTGVRGYWMRRRDEALTFMEVYEDVRDEQSFEAVLARESALLGLERHMERFVCA